MQKLYLKVLKRLSKNPIGQETDISNLFDGYFKNLPKKEIEQTDEGEVEPSDLEHFIEKTSHPRSEKICEFLNLMKTNGHLVYTNNPVNSTNFNWVKRPINISAHITKEGADYYRQNKNKWWELWSFWVAVVGVIITGIAAWFTYFDVFNKDNAKHETEQLSHNKPRQLNHSSQYPKQPAPKTLPSDSSHK